MCNTTKKIYSVQATSTTTHLTPLNATLYLTYVKLHTTTKLLLTGRKYLCFLINEIIFSGCQVCQLTSTANICQYQLIFFTVTKWFGFHSWYLFEQLFHVGLSWIISSNKQMKYYIKDNNHPDCLSKGPRIKDHMKTIGIDQSVSNRDSFKHNFFKNIKEIYQRACKCNDQKTFKDVIEDAMISIPKK